MLSCLLVVFQRRRIHLTMTPRPCWWWLHVLFLVFLQHTLVSSEDLTSTNDNWGNITTVPDLVYHTTEETTRTPDPTIKTYWGNGTTGPDQVYNISEETTRTSNTTLETFSSNITTGPDQVFNTSKETTRTSNTTLETFSSNNTTGPDQVYNINEETPGTPNTTQETYKSDITTGPTRTPNSTQETFRGNITTGLDQVYNTSKETSGISTTTLETYNSNNTTVPDQVYNINEETPGSPNTTLVTYTGNVTTGLDLVYSTSKVATRSPNTTQETYRGTVTTGPDPVYNTNEETSRTPNTTLEIYTGNATMGPDLVYITSEETLNTTLEASTSNFTTRPDLAYIVGDTSGPPNSTLGTFPNSTIGPDLSYINETSTRTPNTTIETYPSNGTTEADLSFISEETSRTSNTTPDFFSHLSYVIEETDETPNTSSKPFQSNVTSGTSYSTLDMNRTSYTGFTDAPDLFYPTSEEPTIRTPDTPVQPGGIPYTSMTSTLYCVQDADCPHFTICTDLQGPRVCQCHPGFYLHPDLGCVTARTFPARVPISVLYWDETSVNRTGHGDNEDGMRPAEIMQQDIRHVTVLFRNVLGHIPGYLSTSITDVQLDEGLVTIAHFFSTLYTVSDEDVWRALTVSPLLCTEPHSNCASPLTSDDYQGLSLCDFSMCDSSSSDCHSHGGLVTCECHTGYYKFSPTDRSCRACSSGFRQTEDGCERCPIGFGGFNCEEPYLLAVIVESCVGCVLLVSLITLLVYYFRRKEPQKPMFIDSIVLGVPTDQPSLRLPRAQFSWRREWEWNEPPEKVLTDVHREAESPSGPAIHMKTFGDPARFPAPNSYHGRHNLSFISD